MLLWTRVTPPAHLTTSELLLKWQISTASAFDTPLLKSGIATTSSARDFTVCVDVKDLKPCTEYYYRFFWEGEVSVTGITKTAASGRLEEMKFALVSCANFGFGYFNVYDLATRIDGLELIVHAGDYVYEYEKGEYPGRQMLARHGLRPKHRCSSLADYRQRYACHRRDPALQELHRKLPMIAVWDDHEVRDDAYAKGAEDFDGNPQEFAGIKKVALQAYLEWVPIRGGNPAEPDPMVAHRSFSFGDLWSLILVENRLANRKEPVDVEKSQLYAQVACKKMKEWNGDTIKNARDELRKDLKDPEREMLGKEQVQGISTAVQASVVAGQPFQFLVSQTILSPIRAPKLLETLPLQPRLLRWVCQLALKVATKESIAGKEASGMARMYLGMGKYDVEMNPTAWDGYQAERCRVLDALDIPGSNPIVLAGDSHNAWAHEVFKDNGRRVAVEFDGPAVTSIDALKVANPDTLEYCNLTERGLVVLHVTRHKVHAEYHYVDSVRKKEYKSHCVAAFRVDAATKGVIHSAARYITVDGVIPKRTVRRRVALVKGIHDVSSSMRES